MAGGGSPVAECSLSASKPGAPAPKKRKNFLIVHRQRKGSGKYGGPDPRDRGRVAPRPPPRRPASTRGPFRGAWFRTRAAAPAAWRSAFPMTLCSAPVSVPFSVPSVPYCAC